MSKEVGCKEADAMSAAGSPSSDHASLQWAVVGLVLPALSYLVAHAVAVGQARHYGLPEQLVTVSFRDVLTTIPSLVASLLFLGLAARGLRGLFGNRPLHPALQGFVWPPVLVVAYAVATWWAVGSGRLVWAWLELAGLLALVSASVLVWRIRKDGSLRAALNAMEADSQDDLRWWSAEFWRDVIEAGIAMRPAGIVLVLLATVYVLGLSAVIGRGMARERTEYLVARSRPGQVILLVNDGIAVLAPLTKGSGHVLGDTYEIVNLTDLGPLSLKDIGPLRARRQAAFP